MSRPVWLYRHYKGGLYYVLNECINEADKKRMVVYRSLNGDIWVRPALEFYGFVDEEKKIPRFIRVGWVDPDVSRLS